MILHRFLSGVTPALRAQYEAQTPAADRTEHGWHWFIDRYIDEHEAEAVKRITEEWAK